jgi:hypothetical protein
MGVGRGGPRVAPSRSGRQSDLPIAAYIRVMRSRGLLAVVVLAVLGAASAHAAGGPLSGSVGPGFTIRLAGGDGLPVQRLDPGTYALAIDDRSQDHNFHLTGPGVEVTTDVDGVGTSTFDITVGDGRYQFICDVHPTTMRGTFDVGTGPPPPPPPPPPPTRLTAVVGPGTTIALRSAAGARVRTLKRGAYVITVRDLSKRQNFHLSGAGVNRRTGLAQTGTVTWRLTLRPGTLRWVSDSSPKTLRGTAVVR